MTTDSSPRQAPDTGGNVNDCDVRQDVVPATNAKEDNTNNCLVDDSKDESKDEKGNEDNGSGIPIDRGYAWVIVFACFGMHVLVVGGVKSFGVLFVEIQDKYGVTARELGVAQGITMTLLLGLGFIANVLAVRFTCRNVMIVGGLLSGLGFISTAFITSYAWIYATYCLITGVGFALSYAPCVVMVGYHFRKYRSIANGIAVSGSGIGSFALPNIIRFLLNHYGLFGCLFILAALMFNICVFGFLVRPLDSYRKSDTSSGAANDREENGVCQLMGVAQEDDKFLSMNETLPSDRTRTSYHEGGDVSNDDVEYKELVPEQRLRAGDQTSLSNSHNPINKAPHGTAQNGSLNDDGYPYKYASNGSLVMASLQSLPQAIDHYQQQQQQQQNHQRQGSLKRVIATVGRCGSAPGSGRKLFDWSLMKNPVFLVYFMSCCLGNLGYPNVFIMLPPHLESLGQSRDKAALIMSVIGITDLVGRIFFGWFSDMNIISKRHGFIVSLGLSGILNLMVPAFDSVPAFIGYAAVYGFFAGSYMALIAVLLADTLGTEKLSSAFGLATLGMAFSLAIGPPVCGAIRDTTLSWNGAFIFCGVTTVIGAALPFLEPAALKANARKTS